MIRLLRILWVVLIILAPIGAAAETITTDDLLSVHFPDAEHGWAAGRWGTILHSQDGGQTWTRQQSKTDHTLTAIFFVDDKTGWADGERGTILHTADGGKTWHPQQSPVPYFLMGAYFVDASTGWIVGERTHILHTKDGGKTWEVQFSDEDFILKSVSFADDRHGWAVGEFGFVYHTSDSGQTWELQAGEFGFSEETGAMVGGNYLFDVTAISPQEAWAVGIEGYMTFTTDGGTTWTTPAGGRPEEHLLGIAAAGNGTLVATGMASLFVSRDNGRSWQQPAVDPPITYGWLYGIAPRGDKGFVAVGKEGWIYRAETSADSWQMVAK